MCGGVNTSLGRGTRPKTWSCQVQVRELTQRAQSAGQGLPGRHEEGPSDGASGSETGGQGGREVPWGRGLWGHFAEVLKAQAALGRERSRIAMRVTGSPRGGSPRSPQIYLFPAALKGLSPSDVPKSHFLLNIQSSRSLESLRN